MTLNVGIIGCGNISSAYLQFAPRFKDIAITKVADLDLATAEARAREFGVRALSVEDLLAAKDLDLIINLTIPDAHFRVTRAILEAGKHAYSEKPMVLTREEGQELKSLSESRGLCVGSAPDTFLGGAHQLARHRLDEGLVGKITSGTCHVMSHGMEHWHPNPGFFFQPGAGPVLDVGPYYVTNLIQLIGSVKTVTAMANSVSPTRRVSADGPMKGRDLPVGTPTNIHAILGFESGAIITMGASWDVWAHHHRNMELYGEDGALFVPDPNFFGGDVTYAARDGRVRAVQGWDHPFGIANHHKPDQASQANYRSAGVADMAQAISEGRPHRCSLDLALHAVDVMTGILQSAETGQVVELSTRCERPAPLDPGAARALLA